MKRYILALLIVVAIVGGSFTFSTMGSNTPVIHGVETEPPMEQWQQGTVIDRIEVNASDVGNEFPNEDITVTISPDINVSQNPASFIVEESDEGGTWVEYGINYTLEEEGDYTLVVSASNENGETEKRFDGDTERTLGQKITGSFTNIGAGVKSTGGTILRIFLLIGGIVAVYLSM